MEFYRKYVFKSKAIVVKKAVHNLKRLLPF